MRSAVRATVFQVFLDAQQKDEIAGGASSAKMTLITLLCLSLTPPRLVPPRCSAVAASACSFGPLAIDDALSARLADAGYTHAQPIQENAMELIADGANVVLHAATGSGKTLAFLVPLLARLTEGAGLQAVVVAPSQELAVQLAAEAQRLHAEPASVLLALSTDAEGEHRARLRAAAARAARRRHGEPAARAARPPRQAAARDLRTVVLDEVDALSPPPPPPPPTAGRAGGGAARGRGGARPRWPRWARRRRQRARRRPQARRRRRAAPYGGGRRRRVVRGGSVGGAAAQRAAGAEALEALARAEVTAARELLGDRRRRPPPARPPRRRRGQEGGGRRRGAEPSHPPPAELRKRGVGGVSVPSTCATPRTSTRPTRDADDAPRRLRGGDPEAPLLVSNGASLPKQVAALKREGFAGPVALDALGVAAAGGGAGADADDAGGGDAAGEDADGGAQGEMVRQRAALADAFARREDVPLLVTTELAARGVDLKGVDVVFMVGLPARLDSYVHVAGRSAREGKRGHAVSLLASEEEEARLDAFQKELGIKVERVDLKFLKG